MAVTAALSKQRFRRGTSNINDILAPASTVIQLGVMLWNNSGVAAMASAFSWTNNLATTQPLFKAKFLGVSTGARVAGDSSSTQKITYATDGVFQMDVSSQTIAVGEFVGPAKDAAGNNLLDSTVAKVATYDLAIGVCVAPVVSADTTGLFRLIGQASDLAPATTH